MLMNYRADTAVPCTSHTNNARPCLFVAFIPAVYAFGHAPRVGRGTLVCNVYGARIRRQVLL